MKHTFLLLSLATTILCGCSKESQENGVLPTGEVYLNISSQPEIEISSKANATIDDSYAILIKKADQTVVKNDTYGNLKTPFVMTAGKGYTISAENCSEAVALSANSNLGQARYAGNSTFDVTASELKEVAFTCSMKNVMVSVVLDATFTNAFDLTGTGDGIKVYEASATDRKLAFDASSTLESPIAYFNLPSSGTPQLKLEIQATRKTDNASKQYTRTINIAAAEWHKLTVTASSTSGQAGLDITVNTDVTTQASDVQIDPYE
ncbi:MAG: DUF4493 domain-containing protein [Alistipes sp.]|nr:DUF4493 domain-containing protein [Alistipes sp.]